MAGPSMADVMQSAAQQRLGIELQQRMSGGIPKLGKVSFVLFDLDLDQLLGLLYWLVNASVWLGFFTYDVLMWAVLISFLGVQFGLKSKVGLTQEEINNEKVCFS
jgi:hypothetical protein